MMKKLVVGVAERSYPIVIGEGLLEKLDEFLAGKGGKRAAVISNQIVAPLYMGKVLESISRSGRDTIALTLPDGENTKSWETLNQIYDWLLSERCDRTTTIVALGGGVIGDLAGFAAATYQRGVPFIQIPTTLLSQVDSSVGGKTGINHPLGKNMIGAFWQPMLVVADTTTLSTLPDRELSAGMAEVIKYGLIRDLSFLEWLEMSMDRLMARDPVALATAIERSCANKAEVVVADEFERAKEGGRALLNLGHTFGHAIETGVGYGSWLHGEAVAAGTMMAVELSRRLGWLSDSDVKRIENLYKLARLPVKGPALGADRYLDLMAHDKKIQAGRLRLVLLRAIGQAVTWADAPESDIRAAIEACCA